MRSLDTAVRCLALALMLGFTLQLRAQPVTQAGHIVLAGRNVQLTVVSSADKSPAPWQPGIGIRITAVRRPVPWNIHSALEDAGIAPDWQAVNLVCELNPDMTSFATIPAGKAVRIPVVVGTAAWQRLKSRSQLVAVTLDPELREQLHATAQRLRPLSELFSRMGAAPGDQEMIRSLLRWYQEADDRWQHRNEPAQTHDTFVQLQTEAGVVLEILERARGEHRLLTREETAQLAALHEDMKVEAAHYAEELSLEHWAAPPRHAVTVSIVARSPKTTAGLRVYYTYLGLFPLLHSTPPLTTYLSFPRLGSGLSQNVELKNYAFWAARDGDYNHPLTVPYILRVSQLEDAGPSVHVDLTLAAAKTAGKVTRNVTR